MLLHDLGGWRHSDTACRQFHAISLAIKTPALMLSEQKLYHHVVATFLPDYRASASGLRTPARRSATWEVSWCPPLTGTPGNGTWLCTCQDPRGLSCLALLHWPESEPFPKQANSSSEFVTEAGGPDGCERSLRQKRRFQKKPRHQSVRIKHGERIAINIHTQGYFQKFLSCNENIGRSCLEEKWANRAPLKTA